VNFELDAELVDLRARVRRFVDDELLPLEQEMGPQETLSPELLARFRARTKELGLWMHDIPKEFGGLGMGLLAKAIILAEIGRQITVPWRNQSIFGPLVGPILYQLDDAQKERYLYPVLRGERIGCFAQTEPNAGSDPASMTTSAVRDGDDYVINGHKWFIGWGDIADFIQLVAVTDPEKKARGGISVFLVDSDTPGVRHVRKINTISRTKPSELIFENVRVPADRMVGKPGQGFRLAQEWITEGRVRHAARSMGVISRCLDLAAKRALERVTFGRPLADRQAIQWMIVEMYQHLHQLRLMTYEVAWKADRGMDVRNESYMCKYFGDESAFAAADRCMQIYGALGLTTDLPIELFWREQRANMITEGSTEVLKTTLARHILKEYASVD
jgi:acyl-CoA dehydrogenase